MKDCKPGYHNYQQIEKTVFEPYWFFFICSKCGDMIAININTAMTRFENDMKKVRGEN